MKKILKYITEDRLIPYLKLSQNDYKSAFDLYKKNLNLSSKMYYLLSYFEVVLRNSINNIINVYQENWIINIELLHKNIIHSLENINIKKLILIKNFLIHRKN